MCLRVCLCVCVCVCVLVSAQIKHLALPSFPSTHTHTYSHACTHILACMHRYSSNLEVSRYSPAGEFVGALSLFVNAEAIAQIWGDDSQHVVYICGLQSLSRVAWPSMNVDWEFNALEMTGAAQRGESVYVGMLDGDFTIAVLSAATGSFQREILLQGGPAVGLAPGSLAIVGEKLYLLDKQSDNFHRSGCTLHTYTHMHAHAHGHVHTHTHTQIRAHRHTHIHTYTATHTHTAAHT